MARSKRFPFPHPVLPASLLLTLRHHALFQPPDVLEPGERAIGLGAAGAAVLATAVFPHEVDLFRRIGIDGNTDAGARLMCPLYTIVDERDGA